MNANMIDTYAHDIHVQCVIAGWWDDPNRDIYQTLQLVNTEIAEATEGDRKNLMDDHLVDRPMPEVELADALIRMFDLAGRYGWLYSERYKPTHQMYSARNLAAKHLWLTYSVCKLADAINKSYRLEVVIGYYSEAIASMLYVAKTEGYDIQGAIDEKLEYNKHRADHKRENRAKDGGKKY